ncbi:M1 family metallopeptidase [Sphingomonas naphthae]|uniref:Aminopeptidase n=1 Tax=Sphingomonas naphthae TaxID=1813468 RepID=A0ABY7TM68_9SPHN|nr:M1 family metallopeptidase [Sphingomonas naphthae]WCT74315.1 M1 family metallopeptidase [Sphingomonas naphthae]
MTRTKTIVPGLLALAAPALVGAAAAPVAKPGRLPASVVPIHYDMRIDADAKAMTFKGEETVTVSVASPVMAIVLNAAELSIGTVQVDGAPAKFATDEAAQTLTIRLTKPVAAGTHKVSIGWTGKINQSAAGLFAVDYNDKRGAQRLLVTQFEPADGRRFAPMWDEPGRKATFTLSAYAPKGEMAFSNMPVERSETQADGRVLISFAKTPKMSSYLLFLGIGDMERRAKKVGNTEIGVITRRGALDQGDYALESAARILTYFNDYFGTPYPLPKMDMIAAPGSSQFFSAMENWGAILYFDRAVLVDPKVSSENDRQNVFGTVAHEMAHQWFGDLVTMDWWDDLWLNEGFASWMAGKVAADLNPDWNVDAQDIAAAKQYAFSLDSRTGTHPIVQRITSVEQVNQAFDAITYQKGQAVIRMLEGAVGPDAFREGVRGYMAKHKYSNTVTDDLWASVALAAGKPVKPFMDSFTLQPGVPLIKVGEPGCVGGKTNLPLSQGRFATDKATNLPQTWIVPVAAKLGEASLLTDVSGAKGASPALAGCPATPPLVNPGQYGYYRTLYADRHMAALTASFASLPPIDQVGLMADGHALGTAGYAPLARFLALVDAIPADGDPLVWRYAAGRLVEFDTMLNGDPAQAAFRAKAIKLLDPQFARLGFTPKSGEAPAASQLREGLIAALGGLGDDRVIAGSRKLVAGGLDDIPAAIRAAVVGVYASNATAADWDRLRAMAKAETNPLAQRDLYSRLGSAKNPALADKALALALTDEASVPNRANIIASAAAAHPFTTFNWAVAHKDQVEGLVEASARRQYIPRLASRGDTLALADRLRAFAIKTIPASDRLYAQSTEAGIRYASEVRVRSRAALAAWSGKD